MAETKWGKYIITKYLSPEELKARGRKIDPREPGVPFVNRRLWIDEKVVEGAFYMECHIIEPGSKPGKVWVEPHTHDSNEIIGFIGTDVQHPDELRGEIEMWMEDEKHILTKSCLIYVPKGFKHCPLRFVRIDHPVVHFSVLTGGQYLWDAKK